ncbi:hypothetical protein [Terasakiella sp. A23]|uniref:thermonuclease family protein n=1 Tax=Terasakiella sp. FCG-A23 TaxID=3080561 RepID=UPI0029546BF8|nr:hypothetical protein [Terasakiella sp. A23]
MDHHKTKFVFCLFVGLILVQVKTVFAQTFRDEVVSLTLPFELRLKKTGPVRLAGLLYDKDATALLDFVSKGDKVKVRLLSDKPDRYGRKPAHVYLLDKRWLQGELVRQNKAIPYPYDGEEAFIRDLYLLESPYVQSALDETIETETFGIVQGLVIDVAHIKGTTYLNFGQNWRTDFTVKISKRDHHIFKSYGFDLPTLKGTEIRIRGWVSKQNGPMIEANHPSQIEVID